jgi:hypothetical protein
LSEWRRRWQSWMNQKETETRKKRQTCSDRRGRKKHWILHSRLRVQDWKMNLLKHIDGSKLIHCDKATVKRKETLSEGVPNVRNFFWGHSRGFKKGDKDRMTFQISGPWNKLLYKKLLSRMRVKIGSHVMASVWRVRSHPHSNASAPESMTQNIRSDDAFDQRPNLAIVRWPENGLRWHGIWNEVLIVWHWIL